MAEDIAKLSKIILDIVAIIAILSVILLADIAEQNQMRSATGNTLRIGTMIAPVPGKNNPCSIITCRDNSPSFQVGLDKFMNIAICQCPNQMQYRVSLLQYYYGPY